MAITRAKNKNYSTYSTIYHNKNKITETNQRWPGVARPGLVLQEWVGFVLTGDESKMQETNQDI
jgi:hypothetical protein